MGAGKTSVGRALAARVGRRFVDLDDLIVSAEGRPITAIFAEHGEAHFRRSEARELERLLAAPGERLILSLGGGAFVAEGNRETLRQAGAVVVHLRAPIEELRRRIGESPERPLASDPQKFQALHDQRQQAYAFADLKIETAGRSVEEVAAILIETITSASAAGKQNPGEFQQGGQF